MNSQPKARPRALTKADRSRSDAALYLKNRKIALARDKHVCRVCGGAGWQTHHVERRSHYGSKRVLEKHDPSNLLTVCDECHGLFTGNALKAVSTTTQGTNGPVLLTKWDDRAGGFVTFRNGTA